MVWKQLLREDIEVARFMWQVVRTTVAGDQTLCPPDRARR